MAISKTIDLRYQEAFYEIRHGNDKSEERLQIYRKGEIRQHWVPESLQSAIAAYYKKLIAKQRNGSFAIPYFYAGYNLKVSFLII